MPRSDQAIEGATAWKARYPALSFLERLLILAIAVTQFLIGHGRVWAQAFDWDRSILWSYVTIAALVAIALAWRHRLSAVTWFLHTVELVGIKFLLTAGFLLGFLITHPQAPAPAVQAAPSAAPSVEFRARTKPRPTTFPAGSLADIQGRVTGGHGQALPGVLVFVSGGLDQLGFESPTQPVRLQNDGKRFSPSLAVVQVGQPLMVRSANHELHTVQMMKRDHSWVLNVPLLASGEERTLEFNEAKGLVSLECKVHQVREGPAHLVILNHPFHAFSDGEGRFTFTAVPKQNVTIAAFDPIYGESSASVPLDGGSKANVVLQLPR